MIKAAFAAMGVYPFNPDAISEDQMKASLHTSTKASFPLAQPSPVRAVIAAMGSFSATSLDLSPSSFIRSAPLPGTAPSSPPTSPLLRRMREPELDPELETPTKRMRIFYSALAFTSSGSALVSKTKITSAYKIAVPVFESSPDLPQPDWRDLDNCPSIGYESREALIVRNKHLTESLWRSKAVIRTHEVIEERSNAQLIVQHAYLGKLNQALHTRENKKATDRTVLFVDGMGRHLTNPKIIEQIQAQEERKKRKAEDKSLRAEGRAARKLARAAIETEWEVIKQNHKEAVAEWGLLCQRLRSNGAKSKELPKKPKCPLNPELPPVGHLEDDDSDDNEEEEEEE